VTESMDWTVRPLDYEPPEVDTTLPHSARVYDYLLGGKDNYPVDRAAGDNSVREWPAFVVSLRQSRRFMHRVTRHVVEHGIDQFLDLGTGIPTSPNLHEIAQGITPSARVVYVDNDPIFLAHAQALLTSTPQGRVAYIHADLRETDKILDAPDLRDTLDLERPVALSILTVLQLFTDDQEVRDLIARYMDRLPCGSFLALTVATEESNPEAIRAASARLTRDGIPIKSDRTKPDAERFFTGLDLVDPGVVLLHRWRPDAEAAAVDDSEISQFGAVAIKRSP
jgi:O-methyltransferase involved in polyketide biosynthesis